jgi:hypothetical protein
MMTDNQTSPVEQELMRFFIAGKAFQKNSGKPAHMPACLVDEAWHTLQADEKRYNNLTLMNVNSKIDHLNDIGYGELEWVSEYEELFGKLTIAWFTASDNSFNSKSYNDYLKTGKFHAAWNCTPRYEPIGIEKPKEVKLPINSVN